MDKELLINNVKTWIELDNDIKKLQHQIREKRSEKKEYTVSLANIMKSNEIDCLDIKGGSLSFAQQKVKKPISKKHLMTCLKEFFKDNVALANELSKYILESRDFSVNETIKRK